VLLDVPRQLLREIGHLAALGVEGCGLLHHHTVSVVRPVGFLVALPRHVVPPVAHRLEVPARVVSVA
jgi:hypothetical protein